MRQDMLSLISIFDQSVCAHYCKSFHPKNEMKRPSSRDNAQPSQTLEGITQITVGGFKSISREQSIEVRPLTILAGANSSGKSSIMQPLLLLKQTLEVPY